MSSPSFGSNNSGYQIRHNGGTINGFIANIRNESVYVQQTPLQLKEEETRILSIRKWLNAPNAEINQVYNRKKRHEGTGEWFLNSGSFRDWLSTPDSFLWVHGVPGSGKSVLFSTAVENIKRCHADAGLAFFYFDFNDPSKLNASAMLRSLISQLPKQGQESDCVKKLWQVCSSLDFETSQIPLDELIICLRHLAQQFANIYILLDALDVCPEYQERECVLESIATMRQWGLPALHLLVSSHDTIDIRRDLDPRAEQEVNMRNPDVDRDISNYVYHELTTRKNLFHWRNDRVYLQAELEKRAQGVYVAHKKLSLIIKLKFL